MEEIKALFEVICAKLVAIHQTVDAERLIRFYGPLIALLTLVVILLKHGRIGARASAASRKADEVSGELASVGSLVQERVGDATMRVENRLLERMNERLEQIERRIDSLTGGGGKPGLFVAPAPDGDSKFDSAARGVLMDMRDQLQTAVWRLEGLERRLTDAPDKEETTGIPEAMDAARFEVEDTPEDDAGEDADEMII